MSSAVPHKTMHNLHILDKQQVNHKVQGDNSEYLNLHTNTRGTCGANRAINLIFLVNPRRTNVTRNRADTLHFNRRNKPMVVPFRRLLTSLPIDISSKRLATRVILPLRYFYAGPRSSTNFYLRNSHKRRGYGRHVSNRNGNWRKSPRNRIDKPRCANGE